MQKIMIVEDDEFLREELANIYQKSGYEVMLCDRLSGDGFCLCSRKAGSVGIGSWTSGNQWIIAMSGNSKTGEASDSCFDIPG